MLTDALLDAIKGIEHYEKSQPKVYDVYAPYTAEIKATMRILLGILAVPDDFSDEELRKLIEAERRRRDEEIKKVLGTLEEDERNEVLRALKMIQGAGKSAKKEARKRSKRDVEKVITAALKGKWVMFEPDDHPKIAAQIKKVTVEGLDVDGVEHEVSSAFTIVADLGKGKAVELSPDVILYDSKQELAGEDTVYFK